MGYIRVNFKMNKFHQIVHEINFSKLFAPVNPPSLLNFLIPNVSLSILKFADILSSNIDLRSFLKLFHLGNSNIVFLLDVLVFFSVE